jgi:hypothetical protein
MQAMFITKSPAGQMMLRLLSANRSIGYNISKLLNLHTFPIPYLLQHTSTATFRAAL